MFGTRETALQGHFYLSHDSPFEVVAFTVDRAYVPGPTLRGLPVVPFEEVEALFPPGEHAMFVGLSYGRPPAKPNELRASRCAAARKKGYRLPTYVSSRATVWPSLGPDDGVFIMEGVIVQSSVEIGRDTVIGVGSLVAHDSTIGEHCFLSAGVTVAGRVTIEPHCFLGAGCTIRDGVRVAQGSVIGAGAVVLRDTRPGGVYSALPARLLPTQRAGLGSG